MVIVPEVGERNPRRSRPKVDFPAPFGPATPTTSLRAMDRARPVRIARVPIACPTGLDQGVHQLIMNLRSVDGAQRIPSAAYLL